ncbi:TPA: DEAD/DEAH box helicase [Candidatus Woesearchaeota archaeon]|nr:DEAD/DEAH box helicase [Candidatus Woesearchaeota archaeon]
MAVADIVVGTPGRLLDHLQRGNLDLSKLRFAVLDEADKMVAMGFIEDVDKILSQASKDMRMQLFGATISDEIKMIKRKYMRDPVVAEADKYVKNEYLKQYYYNIEAHEKFSLLVHLLKKEKAGRAMIFCAKRSTVEVVTKNLRAQGIDAEMPHGKLSQNKRLEIINEFKNGKSKVLVASAVAARGLDIKDVTHILNYDLSQDPQEYIHRVGRTARAGEAGKAITLLGPMDHDAFRNVLYYYDVKVDLLPKENFPMLRFDARSRQPRRGFGFGFGRGRDARPRHSDRAPRQGAYGSHPGGRRDARPRSHPGRSPRNRNHSGQQFSRPRSHGFHGERVSA